MSPYRSTGFVVVFGSVVFGIVVAVENFANNFVLIPSIYVDPTLVTMDFYADV